MHKKVSKQELQCDWELACTWAAEEPRAPAREVKAMAEKLRKLKREIFRYDIPESRRRNILDWITWCFAELMENPSVDTLSAIASVFETMQTVLDNKNGQY